MFLFDPGGELSLENSVSVIVGCGQPVSVDTGRNRADLTSNVSPTSGRPDLSTGILRR